MLKFLDNSYTRAYACKIICHSLFQVYVYRTIIGCLKYIFMRNGLVPGIVSRSAPWRSFPLN